MSQYLCGGEKGKLEMRDGPFFIVGDGRWDFLILGDVEMNILQEMGDGEKKISRWEMATFLYWEMGVEIFLFLEMGD